MNKMMKKTLKVVITTIFLIILISGSISYGLLIKNKDQVLNFCNSHYKNKTFLLTMIGDEPAEPKVCDSTQWRTGWAGKCNSTCVNNYNRCLEENATKEQVEFSRNCCWMCKDYFLTAEYIFFTFFLPEALVIIVIASLYWDF